MGEQQYGDIVGKSDFDVILDGVMGTDATIVRAARTSTRGLGLNKDDEPLDEKDTGLLNYLMRDRHSGPFEHVVLRFGLRIPHFVGRQILRHRTNSFSEESARYRELEPVFYLPSPERPLIQKGKPGAYEFVPGTAEQARMTTSVLLYSYTVAWGAYRDLLDNGVAREIARAALPSAIYSQMVVTTKLRNLLHFLSLRTHETNAAVPSFPQWEIEEVARLMEDAVAEHFPVTYAAWVRNGRPQL